MQLFKFRNYTLCCIVNFFAGFVLFLLSYFLPIWFQSVNGESATQSGLQSIATSFGLIFSSMLAGGLVTKFGHYYTYMPVGHAIQILGIGLISTFDKGSGQAQFIIFMGLTGIGMGFYFQIVTVVAQNAVSIKEIATATATVQFFRTIGAVFGVTYGGLYLNQYLKSHAGPGVDMELIYVDAISNIFLYCIPFAGVGLIASLFIRRDPLKTSNEGPGFAE
jgi:MFS family permease